MTEAEQDLMHSLRVALMAADATLALCICNGKLPAYIEDRRKETARIVRQALDETATIDVKQVDDLYFQISNEAEHSAFWKFQAMWHRAKLVGRTVDKRDDWCALEAEFERFRQLENLGRWTADPTRDIGS